MACIPQSPTRYQEEIRKYRVGYLQSFLESDRSPLTQKELKDLSFFEADSSFRVSASFQLLPEEPVFEIPTSSGRTKPYRKFALLKFTLDKMDCQLYVYESMLLKDDPQYANYLFLPFTDQTNGETSYGGGRYLDLDKSDFSSDSILVDFNKAYNPWCAYSDGYNCPVPPKENDIPLPIYAGERIFTGPYKYQGNDTKPH